jgi:hypothetical protein
MNIVTTMKGSPKVGKIAVTEHLLFPERNREKNKNVPNDNPDGLKNKVEGQPIVSSECPSLVHSLCFLYRLAFSFSKMIDAKPLIGLANPMNQPAQITHHISIPRGRGGLIQGVETA